MFEFEWDTAKAKINERKHGIVFEDAILIFDDPCVISEQDRIVEGEFRWQSIGLVRGVHLLLVAHTSEAGEREGPERVRIISARKADRQERARYEQNRTKNLS